METNDSNIKPQSTGGLKVMTVFVFVLAAHVLVIGGFATYYLIKGGSADIELTDKAVKAPKVTSDPTVTADNPLPDAAQADKTASASPADGVNIPTNPPTPAPEPTASTASTTGANSSTPTANPLRSEMATTTPQLAPVPAPTAATPSGPVKMPAFQPDAAPIASTPYVVKAHDSLAKIAHLNHTTVAKLKEANSLNTDMLRIGQKLVIPARTQVATAGAPAANLDSSDTAAILDGSAPAPTPVKSATAKPAPKAMTVAKTSTTSASSLATTSALQHHLYTVVKGDTLTKIAREFKTTSTAIMAANNITDASKLSIGKKLKIPAQSPESRSAKNNVPAATPPSQESASTPTGQLANFVQ